MLVLPENFGLVEPGVYRSSKIESENFPFLETLRLRLLVILDAEKPPRSLSSFLESNQIELFNLGGLKISNHHDKEKEKELKRIQLQTVKTEHWMLIEKNLVLRALELILDKTKHNVLLIDSTATLVGILRKIQKWNFNSILNEYRTFNGHLSNYYAETFLELIEIELVPAEIEQLNSLSTKVRDPPRRNNSIEDIRWNEDTDDEFDDDDQRSFDDEDLDGDMLSASPQIPNNLLKLVERKQKTNESLTPGTLPKPINAIRSGRHNSIDVYGSRHNSVDLGSRHNSVDLGSRHGSIEISRQNEIFARTSMDKRRSSVDTKRYSTSASLRSHRPLFELNLPNLRRANPLEVRQKYDSKYYHNLHKYAATYDSVSVVKCRLPLELRLPQWFIDGRIAWEERYKALNGEGGKI